MIREEQSEQRRVSIIHRSTASCCFSLSYFRFLRSKEKETETEMEDASAS
jgi:hypothetical protein